MKRYLMSLCAAVAVALGLSFGAQPAFAQQEIKIGIVASLSGPFVAAAKDTVDGVNAWLKTHGVPGKKIVFETLDDETNPVSAANAFRRLAANDDIKLIYLFIPSNSALAVKALASEFKVPIVSGGGADTLGVPADPYLFKVAPAVKDFMTVVLQYAKKKGYTHIASLNSSDAFGQFESTNLKKLAPQFGIQIHYETFSVEDTNFNAQLTKIRAANPQMLYNGASGRAAILTYQQIKQLDLKVPLVVTQAAISKAFYDAIGGPAKADGLLTPVQLGTFGEKAGGDTAKYYTELEKALGRVPPYFATFGFDVGLITEYALKHSDGTREGIRKALASIKDLPALNGPVTYTEDDHTGQNFRSIGLGRLVDGKATLVN